MIGIYYYVYIPTYIHTIYARSKAAPHHQLPYKSARVFILVDLVLNFIFVLVKCASKVLKLTTSKHTYIKLLTNCSVAEAIER